MIHMIGNAHIDPVWLWDWREGYQEVRATFRSALDRLKENNQFVFTCACADYYRFVEENHPDMFDEIRERVREGRWVIVGGMWIQPDCNMPSGEAVARQLLYSQRYFTEKFGRAAVTGYNVDSFGHGATLPALLSAAGMKNYVFMRPGAHENGDIPAPLFIWQAPDGSAVTAFRIPDAYCTKPFGEVPGRVDSARALSRELGASVMCFYGVGNHGGGPTIGNLREINSLRAGGDGDVIYSSPDRYFDEIRVSGISLPVWQKEMQHHASGCYSANSAVKRMNRRAENALFEAERFCVLANRVTGFGIPSMEKGFRDLMFNQFHDVLCGCCVREAYDDALMQLGEAVTIARRAQTDALMSISWKIDTSRGGAVTRSKDSHFALWENGGRGTPVIVFNPHEFEAEGPVQVMGALARVTDENGAEIPAQTVRASRTNGRDIWDTLFTARVPAFGWRLYWVYLEGERNETTSSLKITENTIENGLIRAEFDTESGELTRLTDKTSGFTALTDSSARLIDIEHADTWAHGEFTFDKEAGVFGNAKMEILERGPVRARLRVTSECRGSVLIREYALTEGSNVLETDARLALNEPFRMVKLCFDTGREEAVTRAEIAYGVAERKPGGTEEICHRFVDISDEEGGLTVLNDCKYSYSACGGEVRLTVANSSIYADHFGQKTRDGSCRHMDMDEQSFRYAMIPHKGPWQKVNPARYAILMHQPLEKVVETYHEGPLGAKFEGLTVSEKNLAVGAVKRSECNDGYILRLIETQGAPCNAVISAPVFGRQITVSLTPWQIKTLFLPDDTGCPVEELLLTEYPE